MDDARIRQLTEEVLAQIGGTAAAAASPSDLETRVAALESAVARLQAAAPVASVRESHLHVHSHPSLQVLDVGAGAERCVVEPDKPCVHSGQCRALGH